MKRDSRRKPPFREIGPRVIIACEGKTERVYFDEIRMERNLSHARIPVLKPPGTDPLTIVRAAVNERSLLKRSGRWDSGDSAWAVFDGEEHFRNNPHNWNDAIQIADSQHIQLAISNPCIELWYLLHFQEQSASLDARRAREFLRKHISNYERPSMIYRSHLSDHTDEAIAHARQLAQLPSESSLPRNPSTGVADLVELLLKLKPSR